MLFILSIFLLIWSPVLCIHPLLLGFPGGSDGKESACNAACNARDLVQSLGQEDPLEKEMQPTPVFLPGKSHGQWSLAGYSPWGSQKNQTGLID